MSCAAQSVVTCKEDSTIVLMARILGADASRATQAAVATITRRVTYQTNSLTDSGTELDVAETIFDSLQTTEDDPRWTADETGYNFADVLPYSALPQAGRYLVDYTIDFADQTRCHVTWHLDAEPVNAP